MLTDLNYTVSERETIQDPVLSHIFIGLKNGSFEWHGVRSYLHRIGAGVHFGDFGSAKQRAAHEALRAIMRAQPAGGLYSGPVQGLSAAATQLLEDLKDDPQQTYMHAYEDEDGRITCLGFPGQKRFCSSCRDAYIVF